MHKSVFIIGSINLTIRSNVMTFFNTLIDVIVENKFVYVSI